MMDPVSIAFDIDTYRHLRSAKRHSGADGRIEHPCGHDDEYAT
jgi:hypothetical protein